MKTYLKTAPEFQHHALPSLGVLLLNLGTPDAPTTPAVRRYLKQFLSDPRVTELPQWFWQLILRGIILPFRAPRSAKLYAKIWTEQGSPLLLHSQQLADKLHAFCQTQMTTPIKIVLGMRYGNPSIASALAELQAANVQKLLVLPLYPQYSSASTGSTFDALADEFKQWRWIPELRFLTQYHDSKDYICTVAAQIENYWIEHQRPDKLLFSFHGIPQRFFSAGDPYPCQCQKTARLIAQHLQLRPEQWQVSFQSRFGKEEWIKPYTTETLQALAQAGTRRVDVVCPGFAVDCLETLEEIEGENRHVFLNAGGQEFHYIPALNSTDDHVQLLANLIQQHTQTWQTPFTELQQQAEQRQQLYTQAR